MQDQFDYDSTESHTSIKPGIDVYAKWYCVARQFDGATLQPRQQMTFDGLLHLISKQQRISREIFTCCEAGVLGFHPRRKFREMGVTNYVVQAQGSPISPWRVRARLSVRKWFTVPRLFHIFFRPHEHSARIPFDHTREPLLATLQPDADPERGLPRTHREREHGRPDFGGCRL